MVDLSMLQVVGDIVAVFWVIAGVRYYVMTVRNAEKSRRTQLMLQVREEVLDGIRRMAWKYKGWNGTASMT
jgi:hypothetical protein